MTSWISQSFVTNKIVINDVFFLKTRTALDECVSTGMEIKPVCHFLRSAWEPCHFLSWSTRHYKQSVTFTVYSYETSQPPRFVKIALSESSLLFPSDQEWLERAGTGELTRTPTYTKAQTETTEQKCCLNYAIHVFLNKEVGRSGFQLFTYASVSNFWKKFNL